MKTGPIFEERAKYHDDFPGYQCETCEEAFDEGELLELPCEPCPIRLFGEPDRASILTYRLIEYLHATPALGMGVTPPWELLCAMAGIQGLDTLREVWVRLGILRRLEDERRKKLQEQEPTAVDED